MKNRTLYIFALVVFGTSACVRAQEADAADPQKLELAKSWLKFFAGNWEGEGKQWTPDNGWQEHSATEKAELLLGGNAVVSHTKAKHGDDVGLIRCLPNGNVSFTGISSDGVTWELDFDTVTAEKLQGKTTGALPDGQAAAGSVTLTKTSDTSYEFEYELSAGDTEVAKGSATWKKAASSGSGPGALEAIE